MNIAFFNLMQILALSSGPNWITKEFINLIGLLFKTIDETKGNIQILLQVGLIIECRL
jgi:hypothetical protein